MVVASLAELTRRAELGRVDDWRPEPGPDGPGKSAMWAAVGRKR